MGCYNPGLLDLASEAALPYLAGRLNVPLPLLRLTPLGGGVSNTVVLAEGPGTRCVVKQALGKLRVAEDWFCTPERIFRESQAIVSLSPVLPPGAVPRFLFEDRENYLFAMSAAPSDSLPWKSLLLGGVIDEDTARSTGQLLSTMILSTEEKAGWQKTFGDLSVFVELRLDPYYRTTASRHPDLKQSFDALLAECAGRRISLVHGDFSPKNLLVSGSQVILIDYEVVHFGDPSFDAAFLTSHLVLKAFHRPLWAPGYRKLAAAFWAKVRSELPGRFAWFEPAAMRHLGALMLARIDGKSPAEYITEPDVKSRVRAAARAILLAPPDNVDAAFEAIFP
ncbi:MAG: phosphotransferase [Bryobacterales bacterium]|nr:phosphotransferase [Bryobacterales bacterium]